MSYATQLAAINKGELSPLLLVLGTEQYFMEEVKQAILNQMGEEDRDLNVGFFNLEEVPLSRAMEEAESLPFFGERRFVFIENPSFLTGEKGKTIEEADLAWFESYLDQPSESTVLVLIAAFEKLDNRKKITKKLLKKATIVDVAPLSSGETRNYLMRYIKEAGYEIDRAAAQLFFERTEDRLSKGMHELDKLFLAAMDAKQITRRMVSELIPRNLEQNIFEIVTHVLARNTQAATQTYQDLIQQKEEPLKINAILLGQFRLLIQVYLLAKKGYQQPDMAKQLKIHPYRIKLASQYIQSAKLQDLKNAYLGLVEAERNMKTGNGLKDIQFEWFLLKYVQQ